MMENWIYRFVIELTVIIDEICVFFRSDLNQLQFGSKFEVSPVLTVMLETSDNTILKID